MEIRTFQCPKCRAILQMSGTPQLEKIVRCTQCEFIFPAPVASARPSPLPEAEAMVLRPPNPAVEQPAPGKWVDWQPAMKVEPPPAAEPLPRRTRRRFRPKRRPFPWVFLVVGLLVGLASIGLLIVLIVALWPSG